MSLNAEFMAPSNFYILNFVMTLSNVISMMMFDSSNWIEKIIGLQLSDNSHIQLKVRGSLLSDMISVFNTKTQFFLMMQCWHISISQDFKYIKSRHRNRNLCTPPKMGKPTVRRKICFFSCQDKCCAVNNVIFFKSQNFRKCQLWKIFRKLEKYIQNPKWISESSHLLWLER